MRVKPQRKAACRLRRLPGVRLGNLAAAAVIVLGVAGLTVPLFDRAVRTVPSAIAEPPATVAHQHESTAVAAAAAPPRLADQLAVARSVALRWPTVAAALADGSTLAAPYVPGTGAHYLRFSDVDGTFDVAHPEMLLHAWAAPGWQSPDGVFSTENTRLRQAVGRTWSPVGLARPRHG